MWEIFKYKSVKFKEKLNNVDQVTYIVKFNECNMAKKEVKGFGQQRKTLDSEKRIVEHSVKIL